MEPVLLKFEHTVEEVNQILSALGQCAYKDVYMLVQKIQTQAKPQISPTPLPAVTTEVPVSTEPHS
jgi:hypothetical protein